MSLTVLQGAASAANAAIHAYLNATQTTHIQSNGESLFDEDNWAKILDSREILYLVQPLISRVREEDFAAFWAKVDQCTPTVDGGHRLDGEPIKLDDFRSLLLFKERLYKITKATQRLAEHLHTANGGPMASTPKAWNLHVSASLETAIEVFRMYKEIDRTFKSATASSTFALIHKSLHLCDKETLATAERAFSPIKLSETLHPRIASERKYLALCDVPVTGLRRTGSIAEEIGWGSAAFIGGGLIGFDIYWSTKLAQHNKAPKTVPKAGLSSCGNGQSGLKFTAAEPHTDPTEKSDDTLRFGVLVQLSLVGPDKSLGGLFGSAAEPGIFRVLHIDDRYRYRDVSRPLTLRDRLVLKDGRREVARAQRELRESMEYRPRH
ncbi:hypothetical protein FHETE_7171 [Fusarium heterosporum]|uniref:Uncharacterized protein n=1 Tax=Fusarium heterosporum TaxID=42747 RepID=A0A8H5T745_FUSHE|nr:hypothetical protein FHETE_7171 [Fusarium heterosporum]